MKKKIVVLVLVLCLLMTLFGCGRKSAALDRIETESISHNIPAADAPDTDYSKMDSMVGGESKPENAPSASGDIYTNDGNKIIRTASMTIQTTEFDASTAALKALTEKYGGYFESAEVSGGGYYDQYASRSGHYVVRIPKENFVSFRDGTGSIGHVYSISENSQDVGEAYYDTEARLATLTTKRDRLLALLEKAEYMEDIISLESALADVQYEIDMHTSTLRKYDSLIDYSTFRIRLEEVIEYRDEPGVKESFGSRLVSSLKAGFRSFGSNLQDFAIWLARNLIGVVILAAVVVVVVIVAGKKIRRRRERKSQGE